jgi:hypothetical protein
LPAAAAAAVAFDAPRGRAIAACLNGEIVCLQHSSFAPQQNADRQQQAGWLPVKRRRVADSTDEAAGDESIAPLQSLPAAARARSVLEAAQCTRQNPAAVADADTCFTASVAAAAASPVFGRPLVDAAIGIVVCATVAGNVMALSPGVPVDELHSTFVVGLARQ